MVSEVSGTAENHAKVSKYEKRAQIARRAARASPSNWGIRYKYSSDIVQIP